MSLIVFCKMSSYFKDENKRYENGKVFHLKRLDVVQIVIESDFHVLVPCTLYLTSDRNKSWNKIVEMQWIFFHLSAFSIYHSHITCLFELENIFFNLFKVEWRSNKSNPLLFVMMANEKIENEKSHFIWDHNCVEHVMFR